MNLIIFAHPDSKSSHNAQALSLVIAELEAAGEKYELIDLYRDGFKPEYTLGEYRAANSHSPPPRDKLLERYQKLVTRAETLIFIYPIWWYGAPAIMKGFLDRVFSQGFAYSFKRSDIIPDAAKPALNMLLGLDVAFSMFLHSLPVTQKLGSKNAIVINTYGGSSEGFSLFGRAPEFALDKAVLNFCGIEPVIRVNWWKARGKGGMPNSVREQIRRALGRI